MDKLELLSHKDLNMVSGVIAKFESTYTTTIIDQMTVHGRKIYQYLVLVRITDFQVEGKV